MKIEYQNLSCRLTKVVEALPFLKYKIGENKIKYETIINKFLKKISNHKLKK